MSLDFTHSIQIQRQADEVFAYIADFEHNPAWQGGMQSCHWTSDERMVVGATYVQQARFLGRTIDTHFRVTEFRAGRSISIESTVSTFPIQVTRSVDPQGDDACRVTAHVRGQPKGLLKLLSGMVKKSIRKDYQTLKTTLEARSG
ncbi:MAG: SRPBCC family protein [Deltaproteobacteria bacterium]|nr:SRPBCC family protein [Deltaproteobacteria bacterium]